MKKIWILVAALLLVIGAGGYTLAQMGGQGGMMGQGGGMMGPGRMGGGTMGQGGQGAMMGGAMMSMMHGQALTPEQLEQFAKQHGITVEQAKQMTDGCTQMMAGTKGQQQTQ
ncbi:MAG: hypothetical protein HY712_05645 [candidate division NC10 bacterium]|nr:hypothetical protein [candidate division NC10 bacterium]